MVAKKTIPHPRRAGTLPNPAGMHKRLTTLEPLTTPHRGALVLIGHTIKVFVDHGHLIVEDGLLGERKIGRFPRVHHGLRRVVVIGNDGFLSLSAIRWMADQAIGFAMLERDGKVLLNTGPTALSDTRLRRAQALALDSPAAIEIVRELIRLKLAGQETIVQEKLRNVATADTIADFRRQLPAAATIDAIRQIEGKAATIYWSAWQDIALHFPTSNAIHVPNHWKTFGMRRSPLSFNARKATNPVNAILNYLYTVLETETRLAVNALGLDPGFGLLHADAATRDSLVYDLMEPVRPKVDAYVLDWIKNAPLKRSMFFEQADGTCRLMAPLTVELSNTAMSWQERVAPITEWFAQQLCSSMLEHRNVSGPGTRITQQRRKDAKRVISNRKIEAPKPQNFCFTCGEPISFGNRYCSSCAVQASTSAIVIANTASKNAESLKKRSAKMQAHCDARRDWLPDQLPVWLTPEAYVARIQPLLRAMSRTKIQQTLQVSPLYARKIATGEVIPHKRHWARLAELVGL